MDSVFRALWSATQPPDIQCYSLIHLQLLRRQTRVSYEHNRFPVLYCRNKQRNFTNNQTSCYRNTRRRWRNSVWKFKQVKLWLEFMIIHETSEKVFLLCKLSLAFLYLLAVMFIKRGLKLHLIGFYRMVSDTKRITTPFEEISPRATA